MLIVKTGAVVLYFILIVVVICISVVVSSIHPVSRLRMDNPDGLDLLNMFMYGLNLRFYIDNLHKVEIVMGVALYFLLWINTKPRDEKILEKKPLET